MTDTACRDLVLVPACAMISVMDEPIPGPATAGTTLRQHKAYMSPERYVMVRHRARTAGMSVSGYLNALVDRDQVDENGRPQWAPTPNGEQLPLAS